MDTPNIKVTEINPNQPVLYPEVCEAEADNRLLHASGDFLDQTLRQLQEDAVDVHGELCSSQRRSFSRRSERGPGKSPSPSRNSPRRHSPAPYSPKRQHRAVSPGAYVDYYDVMLSPSHPSPVPHLVDGSRAQSLASDEFTCISYSDPFSSHVLDSPQSVLGISSEHGCQVESAQTGEMGDKDLGDMDIVADMNGKTSWLDVDCLSPEDTSLEDALVLLEEGGFQATPPRTDQDGHDGDLFLYEVDEQQSPNKNRRHLAHTEDSGHFLAASCADPASFSAIELSSQDFSEQMGPTNFETSSSNCTANISAQVGKVPNLADEVCDVVVAGVVGTDFSSEDEMEDGTVTVQNGTGGIGSASQPCNVSAVPSFDQFSAFQSSGSTTSITQTNSAYADLTSASVVKGVSHKRVFKETRCTGSLHDGLGRADCIPFADGLIKDSGFQHSSPQDRAVEQFSLDDPSLWSLEEEGTFPVLDSNAEAKPPPAMESESVLDAEEELKQSTDLSILQQFSNEYNSSLDAFQNDIMTFSPCTQYSPDRPSSTSTGIVETPHEETPCLPVSKTPEDFALPRLMGCPPLQFPHCHNAFLIHNALSNPYNPDLPTPPIVVTFHDGSRYQGGHSLYTGPFACEEANVSLYSPPPLMSSHGPAWSTEGHYAGSDITKTRSCPNLNQTDSYQFQNPHQGWPAWEQSPPAGGRTGGQPHQGSHHPFRHNVHSSAGGGQFMPSSSDCPADSVNCFRVPSSPCTSRAAVIERLRRVVEKRLSGSLDSLETGLKRA